jgi:hypothetical protein
LVDRLSAHIFAMLPYVLLRSLMHSDGACLNAVLLKRRTNPVHVIDIGKRSYTYAMPDSFLRDIGRLDSRFHSQYRQLRFHIVGVTRILE